MQIGERVLLVAGVLSLSIMVGHASARTVQDEVPIKKRICNAIGCPDTSTRLCAEVEGEVSFPFFSGSVNYQCYEPEA